MNSHFSSFFLRLRLDDCLANFWFCILMYIFIFYFLHRYFLTLSSSILCAIQIPISVKKSLHLLLRKQRKVTLSNSLLFGNKTKLKILNGDYFVKFMYSEKTTKFDEICIIVLTLKFIHSEKATKFCETSTLLATLCTVVKSKVEISQNFVAFSEYMNFKCDFIKVLAPLKCEL